MTWKGHNALHGVDRSQSIVRQLRVVRREDIPNTTRLPSNVALVNETEETKEILHNSEGLKPQLFARTHAQFICKVQKSDSVEPKSIALDRVARLNFEVTDGDIFDWTLYDAKQHDDQEPRALEYVVFEFRPVKALKHRTVFKSSMLQRHLTKSLWRSTLSNLERFTVPCELLTNDSADKASLAYAENEGEDVEILFRVVELKSASDQDDEEEVNGDEDCHRGLMDDTTTIYLRCDEAPYIRPCFDIDTAGSPPQDSDQQSNPRYMDVYCNDEMWFPVRKSILQPCVALTRQVRSKVRERVEVDIDCCTFDRVLLFLIAESNGKGDEYELDAETVSGLRAAAKQLELVRLERMCDSFLGEFGSRVRPQGWRWSEIVERNCSNSGEVIVVIDGMVFDLGRWIHHHPGGDTIIPGQALNIDATVFFEVYHSSRASFLYLRSFYTGDVVQQDLSKIPPAEGAPSQGFLDTLRSFTEPWRQTPVEKIHDSF